MEEVVHEDDINSLPSESEKYEETSHEYEEVSIENTKYELEEIQTPDVVEEELELSLDEGYAIFKEEHDSSTLEPIYDKGFTLLKELHDTTHMGSFP